MDRLLSAVREKLNLLIERCLARLPPQSNVLGLLNEGTTDKYRPPPPSLPKDQRRWLEQIFRDPMTKAAAIHCLVHHSVIVELNEANSPPTINRLAFA